MIKNVKKLGRFHKGVQWDENSGDARNKLFRYCSGFSHLEKEIEEHIIPGLLAGDESSMKGLTPLCLMMGPSEYLRACRDNSSEMVIMAALIVSFTGSTMLNPPKFDEVSDPKWQRVFWTFLGLSVISHCSAFVMYINLNAAASLNVRDSDVVHAALMGFNAFVFMNRISGAFVLGLVCYLSAAFVSFHEYNASFLKYDSFVFLGLVLFTLAGVMLVSYNFASPHVIGSARGKDMIYSDFDWKNLAPGFVSKKNGYPFITDAATTPIVTAAAAHCVSDLRNRIALSKRWEAAGVAFRKAGCDALGENRDIWVRNKSMEGFGFDMYNIDDGLNEVGASAETIASMLEAAGIPNSIAVSYSGQLESIDMSADLMVQMTPELLQEAFELAGIKHFAHRAQTQLFCEKRKNNNQHIETINACFKV